MKQDVLDREGGVVATIVCKKWVYMPREAWIYLDHAPSFKRLDFGLPCAVERR